MGRQLIASKYEILRELGQGSYGKVYLVRHVFLGLEYALKLLNRALSDDSNLIERFKLEAEILVKFSHPGTLQLRDFGCTDDGQYYMATDYCEGEALESLLQREHWFPVLKVLNYMLQILDVLEAAHDLTIVHRDIKPANIIVQNHPDGHDLVKVLDFGIAKLKKTVWDGQRVTGEGYVVGTPEYMSPEQAAAESNVDKRSDLYSCGVLMYELITGEVPFKGKNVLQTILKQLTQKPREFSARLGIPGYIEAVVFKALEKNPAKRYQSAGEFKAACLDALATIRREGSGSGSRRIIVEPEDCSARTALEPNSGPTKILCLDDLEMVLQISRHIFEREGFEVFTSSSFAGIYDYIFSHGVRLMLCDVQMPGLPGTKICEMLKQAIPDMKIVLFSSIPDRELEKLSKQCLADAWINKASKPEEWIAKVRELAPL